MKNTAKLFGLIVLAALIGFASCDNGTGPDKPSVPAGISWSAVTDGAASTVDSTKITFTFAEAVDGLTADNITLSPLTVSAAKGELSGERASWELGITVINQGYITVTIAKAGVSAAAKQVQVFKVAVNPASAGVKTYINGEQVVFAAPVGTGGAYTLNAQEKDDDGNFVSDENNKWIWQPKAEGGYTWDSSAQTLTLTPEKVTDDDGIMTAKANALPLFVAWIQEEIEKEIENRLKWSGNAPYNETRDDAEAAVLENRNEENGTAYTTLTELINALADIRFDETFAAHSYTYTFSNDGVSLILLEALPPPVGTDQLAGKTYSGTISNFLGVTQKDPKHTYVFYAAGRTYIETGSDGSVSSSGCYSYNSTEKRVYLKRAVRNGVTPEQFYDTTVYYEDFDRYPSEADSRASQTNQHFKLIQYDYDPATNVIDSKDSGDLNPL